MITRREAISAMALVSGAAVLPACTSSTVQGKRTQFKYSLNTSTVSGHSPGILKYIDIAAEAGYDRIEVWVRDVQAYLDAGNTKTSLANYVSQSGIEIVSAIGFAPWMTGGEEGFRQMEKEMNMLAEIGCPRIAAPPAGVDPSAPLDLLETGERFAELIDLGRKTGVMPQLEFWGASPSLWHLGQVLQIAAAADDPDVKILPDIYHLFRGGSGFEALKMLNAGVIDLFHMNDYPGEKPRLEQVDADRVYPGDGAAPMEKIIPVLSAMGGEITLSLELFNRAYWKNDPIEVAKTGLLKMVEIVNKLN